MKYRLLLGFLLVLLGTWFGGAIVDAQGPKPGDARALTANAGTAFTYQGQLKRGGSAYNGTCNMQFRLYDAASGGTQIGTTQTVPSVTVTNGLFTTPIDFGAGVFNGDKRFLQIAVMCGSDGGYSPLTSLQELTPAPMALALPGFYTQPNATSPNVIGGYTGNTVDNGINGATIGGGGQSGNINHVSGNYATIAGGVRNTASQQFATVGGGTGNSATQYSTVGGGQNNAASGYMGATVSGGGMNTASGGFATVGGGAGNIASEDSATIPGGDGAAATHPGEMAYANGYFATAGDAQTSVYVLHSTTTDANWTELFLGGPGLGRRINLATNRTVAFDILVVGQWSSGNGAGYRIQGVIRNYGGGTALIGTPIQTILGEDDVNWDAVVQADDANDALVVKVKGRAAATVRWVATIHTSEVAW